MGERRSGHLTEEQLARLQDGESPSQDSRHLAACRECSGRLQDLREALNAYTEYRVVRDSVLPSITNQWAPLDTLIASKERIDQRISLWRWRSIAVGVAVIVCGLIGVTVAINRGTRRPVEFSELLTRSAERRVPSNRMIAIRVHGRTVLRPAVLLGDNAAGGDRDLMHFKRLFMEANYSWQDPLNARSFQKWRSELSDRRDTVSVIHAGMPEQAYRIQTETDAGVLGKASLTLRHEDLRPITGSFAFRGEDLLEVDETALPAKASSSEPSRAPRVKPKQEERAANPSEVLHVLAALNEIGADVGEPIDVLEDAQHTIIIRATGLGTDRQHEVANALKSFPFIHLELNALDASAPPSSLPPAGHARASAKLPEELRRQFESQVGGAIPLQELTDRVLDRSGTLVSRAHAMVVLAAMFSPETADTLNTVDRRLLQKLQQGHASELRRLVEELKSDLRSLLQLAAVTPRAASSSWQADVPNLMRSAQIVDGLLNRLLAGTYTDKTGQEMLAELKAELEELDSHVEFQQLGGGR